MSNNPFDTDRAALGGPDGFYRFPVPNKGVLLSDQNLDPEEFLLVFEKGNIQRALLAKEMVYHHCAQGEFNGEPFIITHCVVCHSGMGFVPIVNDKVHHFSEGGLYDGTALLIDDETRTYWNHISGVAVHGPLKGTELKSFSVQVTNVKAALHDNPNLEISFSTTLYKKMEKAKVDEFVDSYTQKSNHFFSEGSFNEFFLKNMGEKDNRVPPLSHGLGVIVGSSPKFYPYDILKSQENGITDIIHGKKLKLYVDEVDKIPRATGEDGEVPIQLFTRWYGFSFTYPGCDIFRL